MSTEKTILVNISIVIDSMRMIISVPVMKIFRHIPDGSLFTSPVLTIGTFDGVHMGHHRIISALLNVSRITAGDAIVLTFTEHPRKIITPHTPPKILTTADEKIRVFEALGIKNVILVDFSLEMANMTAEEFLLNIILKKMGVVHIVVGYDHAFGKNREGNFDFLKELSRIRGFGVTRVEPKNFYSRPISSTWIRTELEDGNIALASALLGRNYTISGIVTRGVGRGKSIGFPTANVVPSHPDKVLPRDGVYSVRVTIEKQQRAIGMLNIGLNPTFGNVERTIEVHILGLNEDLYGKELEIEFCHRIRDERKFSSIEELIAQLKRDREETIKELG
ncbi:MAG: bifunctional riboflavin kinase/FAD synthetase [Spirochaetes bacterium]|nr:bifunctional riboflavin kinase/FAD synthetase [Spirochaetota bacterium]